MVRHRYLNTSSPHRTNPNHRCERRWLTTNGSNWLRLHFQASFLLLLFVVGECLRHVLSSLCARAVRYRRVFCSGLGVLCQISVFSSRHYAIKQRRRKKITKFFYTQVLPKIFSLSFDGEDFIIRCLESQFTSRVKSNTSITSVAWINI